MCQNVSNTHTGRSGPSSASGRTVALAKPGGPCLVLCEDFLDRPCALEVATVYWDASFPPPIAHPFGLRNCMASLAAYLKRPSTVVPAAGRTGLVRPADRLACALRQWGAHPAFNQKRGGYVATRNYFSASLSCNRTFEDNPCFDRSWDCVLHAS